MSTGFSSADVAAMFGASLQDPPPAVSGDTAELISTTRRVLEAGPRGRTAVDVARYCGRVEVLAASLAAALERQET